jgi:stage V sporulation protein D (sporulation-specific penicillin-binding protein)
VYRNGVRYQAAQKVVRRTISADTAAALTSIMEGVVTDGTAKRARIDGYTVAGKTGTAQKLINGQYSHSDHYASFVGFVPSRNPALAMVVVIDSAKGINGDHGGTVAAPIFKNIAEPALRYLGVPLTINPPPPVLVARHDASGGHEDPIISLVADGPPGTVPDLRGLSARDAVRKLATIGLSARASGDGVVVQQFPEPGAAIDPDTTCRLVLERPITRPAPAGYP